MIFIGSLGVSSCYYGTDFRVSYVPDKPQMMKALFSMPDRFQFRAWAISSNIDTISKIVSFPFNGTNAQSCQFQDSLVCNISGSQLEIDDIIRKSSIM